MHEPRPQVPPDPDVVDHARLLDEPEYRLRVVDRLVAYTRRLANGGPEETGLVFHYANLSCCRREPYEATMAALGREAWERHGAELEALAAVLEARHPAAKVANLDEAARLAEE